MAQEAVELKRETVLDLDGLLSEGCEAIHQRIAEAVERQQPVAISFPKVRNSIIDEERRIVLAGISTDDVDRYGTIVDPAGCITKGFFASHAPVLWDHGRGNLTIGSVPIGRALRVTPEAKRITSEWQWANFAGQPVERWGDIAKAIEDFWYLYRNGHLGAYSITIRPLAVELPKRRGDPLIYRKWDLCEISLCSVPINPMATAVDEKALRLFRRCVGPQAFSMLLQQATMQAATENAVRAAELAVKRELQAHRVAENSESFGKFITFDLGPKPDLTVKALPETISVGVERRSFRGRGVLPHIATRIFNQPLLIAPQKLDTILSVLGERIGLHGGPMPEIPEEHEDEQVAPPGVAMIPVHGTLVHRAMGLETLSGLTSYSWIAQEFQKALADPNVKAILLDIDSPGGEVAGVFDLVDAIYAARGQKPIWAIADEYACSAAYAIASAAERVVAARTARVGSIGVYALHVDQSESDKMEGIAYTFIYAGKHKVDRNPHEPLSGDARKDMQEMVDELYELLVNTVARNRGLSAEAVRGTEAKIYLSAEALELGLIDGVANLQETLQALAALSPKVETEKAEAINQGELERLIKENMMLRKLAQLAAEGKLQKKRHKE